MKIRAILLGALFLAAPLSLEAQSQNASATLTIASNLTLNVTNLTVDFGLQSEPGVYPGDVSSVISHSGNIPHSVTIAADDAFFDAVNAANDDDVEASQMEWSIDGSVWTPLSTSPQPVISGAVPGTYSAAATVQYRVNVEVTDAPDDYTLGFTYSVVAD